MAGAFLKAAQIVLEHESKPLSSKVIVERALSLGVLHTTGKTPGHTMRARLSEEIRKNGVESKFQRIGPNRFALRKWGGFEEYYAPAFKKGIPKEVTVCLDNRVETLIGHSSIGLYPFDLQFHDFIKNRDNLQFIQRSVAEKNLNYKQLIAYVWLETSDGLVLSYIRGKYSSADRRLLLGKRSVGFGGHVIKEDAESLLGIFDAGIELAAIREIREELKGLIPLKIEPVGVIWDNSSIVGQKHIGIALRGFLGHSSEVKLNSTELSINSVEFLPKTKLWDSYHNFEFWSQLLIRSFAKNVAPDNQSKIIPDRPPKNVGHIAIVGEIASGKSSIANVIKNKLGYVPVSVSKCLLELLEQEALNEGDRSEFQHIALEFITSTSGPKTLAKAICRNVLSRGNENCIIDGIRQLSTLEEVRLLLPDLVVVFIDCPRDLAYSNYASRWKEATPQHFAEVREHQVESDLPNFRYQADAILNNADTLDNSVSVFLNWINQV